MSETKPARVLPVSLTIHDADVAAIFGLLSEQLTALAGNVHPLRDIECSIAVDTERGRASLQFRAC